MLRIPASLTRNVQISFGKVGEEWLAQLSVQVATVCQQWELEIVGEFSDLTFSFVAPVKLKDGGSAVLKISPRQKESQRQAHALEKFGGIGSVKLLAHNESEGAVLLERAYRNSEARTENLCDVVKRLQAKSVKGSNYAFPHVATLGLGFEKFIRTNTAEATLARELGLHDELVAEADYMFKALIKSSPAEVLLHGDLHHANLLQRQDGEWVAIDPKGIIGDPCFELGAFLRNPMPALLDDLNLKQTLAARVETMNHELGFSTGRIRQWAYSQAVLAAIWSVRDGGETIRNWLKVVRALK